MDTSKSGGITRRSFLKVGAATAALLATTGLSYGCTNSALDESGSSENPDDEWLYSYCRNCIGPFCGIKVHVKNGVAVGIEGDKDWPFNHGRLCPRGNANLDSLYNPYRVKAPMKRTNPEKAIDNDPGWEEISWDETYETCVGKLQAIKADDPHKLMVCRGFGAIWDDMPMYRPIFGLAFGTASMSEINGPLCPFHYGAMTAMGSFTSAADLMRCNYLVSFGANYGGDFTRANASADCLYTSTALLNTALERGMKLFSFNPRGGGDTKYTGSWVPTKPGDDLPILLAMTEVIMCEQSTYDEEFVKWRSNFPYLIKSDDDYLRDASSNKPMIWDATLKQAVPFDSDKLTDPALEGAFDVDGQSVRPAYSIIKEYAAQFTPEVVEGMTGVSAATIREITLGLVDAACIGQTIDLDGVTFPYRPACVHYGRGSTAHRGGAYVMEQVNIINTLIGSIDVPGGITGATGFGDFLAPGDDGIVQPNPAMTSHAQEWVDSDYNYPTLSFDLTEYYPHRHSTPHVAWRSIVDNEKYYMAQDCEAIMIWGGNPFINNIDRDECVAAFQKVPFVLDIAYAYDETSQFADILLAESSNLERTAFTMQYNAMDLEGAHRGCRGTNFRAPVVDTVYNTKTGCSIVTDLCNQIGMGMTPQINGMFAAMTGIPDDSQYTTAGEDQHTFEEMTEILLKALYGEDKSLDDCLHNGTNFTIETLPESQSYNYYYFPDRTTKVCVWDNHLWQTGVRVKGECDSRGITVPGWDMDSYMAYFQPYPHWIEHPEHQAPAEYDMRVCNWKIAGRAMAIGGVTQSALIREVQAKTDPNIDVIVINSATAAERGLTEGDKVNLTSTNGKTVTGTLHLTELIEPHCLGFAGNYGSPAPFMGRYAQRGISYNQLLSAEDGEFDPVSGGMEITAAVKIEKA